MISYWAWRIAPWFLFIVIAAGVLWETNHLIDWIVTLNETSSDGSLASYLRHHAYVYVKWAFGTDFGWEIGE